MKMGKTTALMLLAAMLAFSAPRAAMADTADSTPAASDGAMSDAEKQAVGCGIGAGTGLLASYAAGPTEVIMLWGGGTLMASSGVLIGLTLLTQMGASSCAMAALATPTVLWAYEQSDNISAKVAQVTGQVTSGVLTALGFGSGDSAQIAAGVE
jgi:hypothetical protein